MEKQFILDNVASDLKTLIAWHANEDAEDCLLALRVLIRDRGEQLFRAHGNTPIYIDWGHGRMIEITDFDRVDVVDVRPVVARKVFTIPQPAAAFDRVFHKVREGD